MSICEHWNDIRCFCSHFLLNFSLFLLIIIKFNESSAFGLG